MARRRHETGLKYQQRIEGEQQRANRLVHDVQPDDHQPEPAAPAPVQPAVTTHRTASGGD